MVKHHQIFLAVCTLLQLLSETSFANQYDPHVYPNKGPFFEGWYSRLTDVDNSRSFGVVFARVLPSNKHTTSNSDTYLSFIRSEGDNQSMEVIDIFPDEENISVTVRSGQQVTSNPDDISPAYFEWVAEPYGYFNVTPNSTVFDFQAHGVRFKGDFGNPIPWGASGEGPEDWLDKIPFVPLHWFVYSLATPGNYTWINTNTSETFSGQAIMHQEKNWGESFPPSWIWTEAVNTVDSTVFAGSFGVVNFGPLNIPAHLCGYRNYKKDIILNFRPTNSFVFKTIDGCSGTVTFTIISLTHKVEITIVTPSSTLDECLLGPTVEGFAPACIESYVARAEITVYKLHFLSYREIDHSVFENSALEFGGGYMCPSGPCQNA